MDGPRSHAVISRLKAAGLILLIMTSFGSCKVDLGPLMDEGRLLSISLDGPSQVQVGDSISLIAMGEVSGLVGIFLFDRILDAKFSVSDPAIASITPVYPAHGDSTSFTHVTVVGRKPGAVRITVSERGISGTHDVEVIEP